MPAASPVSPRGRFGLDEGRTSSGELGAIALAPIVRDLRAEIERRRQRRRDVMANAWVLTGTCVPTQSVWGMHSEGYAPEAILEPFPQLTPEDIKAAIGHEERRRQQGIA